MPLRIMSNSTTAPAGSDTVELPELSLIRIDLGDGVVVRPFVADDAELVFDAVKRNEAHLMEFMRWMTTEYSVETAKEFVERSIKTAREKTGLSMGIFRGDRQIGSIGYVHFDTEGRKTEIGYWIDKGNEGKGIISTATRALIDLAFDKFSMNRVEIRCSTKNKRSGAVPERLGFKLEGCLRESEPIHGRLHDFYIYGLLRREWRPESGS